MVIQRQIVFLSFDLPQGIVEHPAIVLSTSDAMDQEEGRFVAVMMTSNKINDYYTFEITKDMLTSPMNPYQEARLHVVSYFSEEDIIHERPLRYLKPEYFENLIRRINKVTFGI
jgi:hypothetical protein